MRSGLWATAAVLLVISGSGPPVGARAAVQTVGVNPSASRHAAAIVQYCVPCHNQRLRTAGLALDELDLAVVDRAPAVWEKVVRKLRAGAMPPVGRARPDQAATTELVDYLETALDKAAAAQPNPGRPAIHRLNRSEYVNAVRDLFDLEVDGRGLLPADDTDVHGFDTSADVLSISPALLERYLTAALKVSRWALGHADEPVIAT